MINVCCSKPKLCWSDVTNVTSVSSLGKTEANQVLTDFLSLFSWIPSIQPELKENFFAMSQTCTTIGKELHLTAQPSTCTGDLGRCSRGCRCCDFSKEPKAHPIPLPRQGDSETWEAVKLER